MSGIEFLKMVLLAGGLLGTVYVVDRVFGQDTFATVVTLIGLLALALSLVGLIDLQPLSTGWWGGAGP